jgi:undecaprenyl-diphosphatase
LALNAIAPSRYPGAATASVRTILIGIGLRHLLLRAFRRHRPPTHGWLYPATGYSFPSGHSTNAAMASTVITGALWDARSELPGAWAAAAAAGCCYTAAVGGSRVYLGVHWPTDVLAGWLLGVSWSCAARRWSGRAAHDGSL